MQKLILLALQVAVKIVYLGKDTDEDGNMPRISDHPLAYEVKMYKKLGAIEDSEDKKLEGIPTVRYYSKHNSGNKGLQFSLGHQLACSLNCTCAPPGDWCSPSGWRQCAPARLKTVCNPFP